jgi:pimeloyl-ACP methyl ester carboxylesterase
MPTVTSKDGTTIAYEQSGAGPAVIVIGGVLGDRSQQAGLARLLADHFTVYNIDRRGHGESGFTPPYATQREIEDIDALITAAGGSAYVYGTSGLGMLALNAAASGLAPKIKKLAVWEPPYFVDNSRPPLPPDYLEQLNTLLAEDRRGDMVALWMTEAVGMPAGFVAQMRTQPWWPMQEALAHTLIYDAIMTDGFAFPKERLATISVPTLVIDGGQTPWLTAAADATAAALPNATRQTIAGQPHNVADEAMAPVLIEFFRE